MNLFSIYFCDFQTKRMSFTELLIYDVVGLNIFFFKLKKKKKLIEANMSMNCSCLPINSPKEDNS